MVPAIEIITNNHSTKPWLMMVHGVSQNSQVFSAQVDHFQQAFNILLVDLPGHGKSSHIDGPYGLNEFAESLKAAQDHAGIPASHFWGTHLGAGAGLLLAAKHPERILSLVVEGPVLPGCSLPSVTQTLDKVRAAISEAGIEAGRQVWIEQSPWFEVMRNNPEICRAEQQWAMISEFTGKPWMDKNLASPVDPIEKELSQLTVPTLVMNGEYDAEDFFEIADEVHQLIGHSLLIKIPEGGGFPLWEYPEKVNHVVADFYKTNAIGSPLD